MKSQILMAVIVSCVVPVVFWGGEPAMPADPVKKAEKDYKKALVSVLPEGWRITGVETDTFPFYLRKGKGTAFRFGPAHGAGGDEKPAYTGVLYLMPHNYEGGAVTNDEDRQTMPPEFIGGTDVFRLYLWTALPEAIAKKLREDIRRAFGVVKDR